MDFDFFTLFHFPNLMKSLEISKNDENHNNFSTVIIQNAIYWQSESYPDDPGVILKYWVIQNDCGQVWQLCTKIYVATVCVG
jgi:hypothetical protein